MKKMQLIATVALLSAITYHNSSYTWFWGSDNDETSNSNSQVVITRNGVTTVNGVKVSSGGNGVSVITRNGVTYVNGKKLDSSTSDDYIEEAGESETKEIDISDVNNINAKGLGNLVIEQCSSCSETLSITADKNIMPYIVAKVRSQQLNLDIKNDAIFANTPKIDFHVILQDINKISIGGSIDMQSKGEIKTKILNINQEGSGNIDASFNVNNLIANNYGSGDTELSGEAEEQTIKLSGSGNYKGTTKANSLDINITGSSDIDASIEVADLTVNNAGSGDIKLSGEAKEQKIKLSGSGDYKASQLISDNVSIFSSGSSDAYLNVRNNLSYKSSGSGDIYYKGDPRTKGSKMGSGKLKKAR